MNPKKICRKIDRGDLDFKPSSSKAVRMAIAISLVKFFEGLKNLREKTLDESS
jgi:hypothetical protein